ncbi:hypothetical protein N182_27955 [Sinorhizobium sp. GL2]|nr:hypothetical protein N182_27955 [Sinorhizobium sp. GL2]
MIAEEQYFYVCAAQHIVLNKAILSLLLALNTQV